MALLYSLTPTAYGPFLGADLVARAAWGLIYDRYKLSEKKNQADATLWSDEDGIYCVYDQAFLAKQLGVTRPTVNKALQRLEILNLLVTCKTGIGKPVRYRIPEHILNYLSDPHGYFLGIYDEDESCKESLHGE